MEVPYELGTNRRGISRIVSHLTLQAVCQIICVAVGSEGVHGNTAEKMADSVILCKLKVLSTYIWQSVFVLHDLLIAFCTKCIYTLYYLCINTFP